MENINEIIDTAFDLSYLKSSQFMKTDFKSVLILGGGTAGYLTALSLNKAHPNLKIQIVESSRIPVIGVGESTTTEIVPFLHNFLEFEPIEFFEEVEPSFKLGIEFDWGCAGDYKFNFNFFASHQYESYFYEKNIMNSNWPSLLMNKCKMPILKDEYGDYYSFMTSIPFSYHLENSKFVSYLKKKILERNISILDFEIETVEKDEEAYVSSLLSKCGNKFEADFYIDCTGFKSKLLGESLGTEFVSYEDTLITDRALTFNIKNNNNIAPFTGAKTMKNGWCWRIPMREEDHNGYVFSTKFCTEEEALAEVKEIFGEIESYKIIPFKSGRYEKAWNKNVFAIGNAYAFIEPLESTAIQTIIQTAMSLCRLMPKSVKDLSTIAGLNKEITASWDTFRAFLAVHYKYNNKLDTKFWKWIRENINLAGAEEIVELFKQRAPLSKGHFGNGTGYSAYEPLVFNSYSYDTMLFGQMISPIDMEAPEMTKEEYLEKCESYKALTNLSVDQYELFQDKERFYNEILHPLFSDHDSWIQETQN